MRSIKIETIGYRIDLELRHSRTVLRGKSATGKSMLFEAIKAYEILNQTDQFICIDANNIMKGKYGDIVDTLKEAYDKIILIDNANHILDIKEIGDIVRHDYERNNYYILIGRTLTISCDMRDIAKPVISENTMTIRYLFRE